MTFTVKTGVGKIWFDRVSTGRSTEDEIPNLGNLREVVLAALHPAENGGAADAH